MKGPQADEWEEWRRRNIEGKSREVLAEDGEEWGSER